MVIPVAFGWSHLSKTAHPAAAGTPAHSLTKADYGRH